MNVIELENLTKSYRLYERNVVDRFKDAFLPGKKQNHKEFLSLKNIDLKVKKGEILGVVGRNGAGKSTLLKLITGISQPTSGSVKIDGRIVALLELGGGFNPEYTGKENIYFTCALQGMTRDEIDLIYDEVVAFSELGDFIDVPVKKYSSGMKARLGFSVSINIDPDILILDEVLAVGDELFRHKCHQKMKSFFDSGKTIIFVSHSLGSIKDLCTRAILIDKGRLLLDSSPKIVIPYYDKLLSSIGKNESETIDSIIAFNNDIASKTKIENRSDWTSLEEVIEDSLEDFVCEKPFHDPNLISKSKKEVRLSNVFFENAAIFKGDELVNILKPNEFYTISVTLRFDEPLKSVDFGASIYTARESDLAYCWMPGNNETLDYVEEGKSFKLSFKFYTALPDSLYGIRFFVRDHSNGIKVVNNYVDALMFRVSSNKQDNNTGIVRLFQECSSQVQEASNV